MRNAYWIAIIVSSLISLPAPTWAQEIAVSKDSPLYKLVQEYLPTAAESYRETYRRGHSSQVVKAGWNDLEHKNYEGALSSFFLAINMDFKNPSAYFGVAYVCSLQNNMTDAITFYREALKYEKNYSPIYANLAKALLIQSHNDSAEAPQLLDEAIKIDPKNGDAYVTCAGYCAGKGDWKAAGQNASKAIEVGAKLDPQFVSELQKHDIQLPEK
jgi:Tfp pilus assembly protein PilF